ncbi:hypothetical protein HPQ64_11540 [Rhizobiales bacterium]|uniref:SxtJ family membrane protein n=1 Tax=Hongsoonwoonella zoysiae TaxID=2821844 RepID=UPI001560C2BF|nr:SxtJ family membrane protein [Hongsoonwoonella zoysiae]NRG18322.1 hypothetical protein [Hongsoonwoonella zoysiae]
MTHEVIIDEKPEGPSNRAFGYTVGGILIALALIRWAWVGELGVLMTVLGAIGLVLVVAAFAYPDILEVPNKLWTKLGLLLFMIVNPIIMLLVYITTFLPIGLIMRAKGHDPLASSIEKTSKSYWISRSEDPVETSSMRKQF